MWFILIVFIIGTVLINRFGLYYSSYIAPNMWEIITKFLFVLIMVLYSTGVISFESLWTKYVYLSLLMILKRLNFNVILPVILYIFMAYLIALNHDIRSELWSDKWYLELISHIFTAAVLYARLRKIKGSRLELTYLNLFLAILDLLLVAIFLTVLFILLDLFIIYLVYPDTFFQWVNSIFK